MILQRLFIDHRGNKTDGVFRRPSNVVQWGSEEFSIPYRSPIDNKIHRYFPDFWVKQIVDGKTEVLVLEVKPRAQTITPKPQKK